MNVLIQLRETVKHVDIAQISEYRRKIMSARQSATAPPPTSPSETIPTAPPDLYQTHPSVSRVPSLSRGPIIQELPSSPGSPHSASTISNSARLLPTAQYSMSHTTTQNTTSMYRSNDSPSLSTDSYSSSVSNENNHSSRDQRKESSPVPYSVIQSFQSSSLNH